MHQLNGNIQYLSPVRQHLIQTLLIQAIFLLNTISVTCITLYPDTGYFDNAGHIFFG